MSTYYSFVDEVHLGLAEHLDEPGGTVDRGTGPEYTFEGL